MGTSTYCTTSSSLCSILRSTSELRSLLHPLSLSHQQNGPFVAPASETKSAGHAYQLCKPANGRTDRTEETRIKGGLSEPQIQSEGVLCQTHQDKAASQYISKETTPDHPDTMPRGPRHTTAQPSRQQQQLSARHQHQPWSVTIHHGPPPRPSRTSSYASHSRNLSVPNTPPRPHQSHPTMQHTGRGKTNALQSDNYATSTVWL